LRLVADQLGLVLPDGGPLLNDSLTVTLDGAEHDVPWWTDGRLHASGHVGGAGTGVRVGHRALGGALPHHRAARRPFAPHPAELKDS